MKHKRIPRKLKKRNKKKGLLNADLKVHKQVFDLVFKRRDLRSLSTFLTNNN